VPTADGRTIHLHSRHRPLEEAKRLIEGIDCEQHVFYYVHGLGLGYHLELLFERSSDEAVFCVFEPDLLLLRTLLEARDLSKLIASRRVIFFWKLDKGDLFVRLMKQASMISLGTVDVLHAASLQRNGEFHEQMQAWLAEFASFCKTNMNTLVLNGRRTLENIARNLGWYAASPCPSRLEGLYQKLPGGDRVGGAVAAEEQASAEGAGGEGGHHRGADDAAAAAGDGDRAGFCDGAGLSRHLHAIFREACRRS
jgi:hypothetical protein